MCCLCVGREKVLRTGVEAAEVGAGDRVLVDIAGAIAVGTDLASRVFGCELGCEIWL